MSKEDREWYFQKIESLDPAHSVVTADRDKNVLVYNEKIRSDESLKRPATDEELVRALALCLLAGPTFQYEVDTFYIEKYYKHGHPASKHDEVDLIVFDDDDLPFAMWEFKSPSATGTKPKLTVICIDRTENPSFESWEQKGRPHSTVFPAAYTDPEFVPYVQGGTRDLSLDSTQADFRAVAATFHAEFFGEHPDNTLFTNVMKCLLAKIYDERVRKKGERYAFQVLYIKSKEEKAVEVFKRVNELYRTAYVRYIEPGSAEPDEINPKEFAPERVKTVVKVLQSMSITRGAALNADVIGAFFEEILRSGFKQDKGMYFTHSNLVTFILEAIDLDGLTAATWKTATHPENRLPYVIDPACGSGSFLLRAMQIVVVAIRSRQSLLVSDIDSAEFFAARMSDAKPNYWAEHFVYGIDPKFDMAITAKVNMVLHGDGSAHIFKHDSLKPLSTFADSKLKPVGDPHRSIPRNRYKFDMAESFDAVVSNPPFGITIASETAGSLGSSYSLRDTVPSEALFLERWFQLLKPNGRLGVVVPESLLNAAENVSVRLFLYRCFHIRAIVGLPRNLFIETPTLTSLLFAQKKKASEISKWDDEWELHLKDCVGRIESVSDFLKKTLRDGTGTISEIEKRVLSTLSPIIDEDSWIVKKGEEPLKTRVPGTVHSVIDGCRYYSKLIVLAGFKLLVRNYVFFKVASKLNYDYPVYMVDEVGFKLSKRKERIRPNQLCRFVGANTNREMPNLHLADEPINLVVDSTTPERILDYIRRDVQWS